MAQGKAQRGRKPSISLTAGKLKEIRRSLKSLVTQISRVEGHLKALDGFYPRATMPIAAAPFVVRPRRRRGPNVRDLAFQILSKLKRGLPVTVRWSRVPHFSTGPRRTIRPAFTYAIDTHSRENAAFSSGRSVFI